MPKYRLKGSKHWVNEPGKKPRRLTTGDVLEFKVLPQGFKDKFELVVPEVPPAESGKPEPSADEPKKNGPTIEKYVVKGYDPRGYPPKGYTEVSSPGLDRFRATGSVEEQKPVSTEEQKPAPGATDEQKPVPGATDEQKS